MRKEFGRLIFLQITASRTVFPQCSFVHQSPSSACTPLSAFCPAGLLHRFLSRSLRWADALSARRHRLAFPFSLPLSALGRRAQEQNRAFVERYSGQLRLSARGALPSSRGPHTGSNTVLHPAKPGGLRPQLSSRPGSSSSSSTCLLPRPHVFNSYRVWHCPTKTNSVTKDGPGGREGGEGEAAPPAQLSCPQCPSPGALAIRCRLNSAAVPVRGGNTPDGQRDSRPPQHTGGQRSSEQDNTPQPRSPPPHSHRAARQPVPAHLPQPRNTNSPCSPRGAHQGF